MQVGGGEAVFALAFLLGYRWCVDLLCSQGGAGAVFPFPKASWVMEQVVLIPLEHFLAVLLHGKSQRADPGQAPASESSSSAGLTWRAA